MKMIELRLQTIRGAQFLETLGRLSFLPVPSPQPEMPVPEGRPE